MVEEFAVESLDFGADSYRSWSRLKDIQQKVEIDIAIICLFSSFDFEHMTLIVLLIMLRENVFRVH